MLIRKLSPRWVVGNGRPFTTISPQQMEDWQYVSRIQQCLKVGEVNKALSYLINVRLG